MPDPRLKGTSSEGGDPRLRGRSGAYLTGPRTGKHGPTLAEVKAAAAKSGGLGVVGRFGSDLYEAAVSSPRGVYEAGKAIGQDVKDVVTFQHLGDPGPSRTLKLAEQLSKQFYEDLRHPGRHPGFTALDLLAIASVGAGTASRAGAIARAARAGEGVSGITRALVSGPEPGSITLRAPSGETAEVPASRSALGRANQRALNATRNRYPNAPIGAKTQVSRIGAELRKQREFAYKQATQEARVLEHKGKRIGVFSPKGYALRAVAEGTPIELMQQGWRNDVPSATGRARAILEKNIRQSEKAHQYLELDDTGAPRIKADYPDLAEMSRSAETLANLEDQRLVEANLMTIEQQIAAIQKPGRLARGAKYQRVPFEADFSKPTRGVGTAVVDPNDYRGEVVRIGKSSKTEADRLAEGYRAYYREAAGEPDAFSPEEFADRVASDPYFAEEYMPKVQVGDNVIEVRFRRKGKKGTFTREYRPGELSLASYRPLVGAEDFTGGRYHIGQPARKSPFTPRIYGIGEGQAINTGRRAPIALRKQLTGTAQQRGLVRQDVPSIVARNIYERERHIQFIQNAAEIYAHAWDDPVALHEAGVPTKYIRAVKAPELAGKPLPGPVQRALDAIKNGELPDAKTGLAGWVADALRDHIFPAQNLEEFQAATGVGDLGSFEGIRWVDRRLLGGMDEPPILSSFQANRAGRRFLGFVDAINDSQRAAILYLRPAYITPNVVGNLFLTLTQQGLFAPKNIAESVVMHRKLGAEHTVRIDALMGEGLVRALQGERSSLISFVNDLLARGYGNIVDKPFRRASFLYEARKAGYRTDEQIKRLLDDPAHADDLYQIQYRANRALIDYGDLTPLERAVIRRVIFFYPWLKGSTRWAKDYLRDHPQQAALMGQFGELGEKLTDQELGLLPSWAQGIFKVGGGFPLALTINPTSAGVLSQPAQLGAFAAKLAGVNLPGSGYNARQVLTPLQDALLTTLSGRTSFGQDVPLNMSTFLKELGGVPVVTLVQRLMRDQSGKTFPLSQREALLQFLLGGLAPRTTNVPNLWETTEQERQRGL